MASTYSPLLRFELIAPGEQPGLWGNTENVNLGTLVEQAIAGVTFISLTGLSAYTLTTTNGTPDDHRSAVLVFTGVPSGAVTITVPALQKVFIVRNSTAQQVTLKTSAQVGGVAIPAAGAGLIFCDGTSIYSALAGLGVDQGGTGGTTAASARAGLSVPDYTGTGAIGTWGISISGNAATATLATTASSATSASQLGGIAYTRYARLDAAEDFTSAKTFSAGLVAGATTQPSANWKAYIKSATGHPATVVEAIGSGATAVATYNQVAGNALLFSYGSATGVSTVVGSIATTSTGVAFNTNSDYRLKENVETMSMSDFSAGSKVLALRPVTFTWKAAPQQAPTQGFIAHEVQAVCPGAVTGVKDGEEMQQVDHSKLVPILTAALQEALIRISRLERNSTTYYGFNQE